MFTKALYYPHIQIPDNLWLRRAILYWDTINPIVPYDLEQNIPQDHVSRELKSHGMLNFINPKDFLEWGEGEELSEIFLGLIDSQEFRQKIGPVERRDYSCRIHMSKFADALLSKLKNVNLSLSLFKEEGDWLLFETYTGTIYMGFLAFTIAKRMAFEPITDNRIYQNGYLLSQPIPFKRHMTFISCVLENLLPTPEEVIPVKQLIEFKEKHRMELLAFRGVIRNTLETLKSVSDESQFKMELEAVKDEINERCLILERRLRENKIQTTLNCLKITFTPSIKEMAAVAGGMFISVPITATLFGTKKAIELASEIHEGFIMRKHSIVESCPYSYVYNVKKKFV